MTVENIGHEEDQRFELCLGVEPKIFVNYVKRGEKRRKKKKYQLSIESKYWQLGSKDHERLFTLVFCSEN